MGMPVTVEVVDRRVSEEDIEAVFDYFAYVDNKFSTWKKDSEISDINRGIISPEDWSGDMREVMRRCEETRKETEGYFDANHNGKLDPSGLVKGWAVLNAANLLENDGFRNYYVEAGGDIQVRGKNSEGQVWRVGIRNPFNRNEIVKAFPLDNRGIATSGTYIRGQHVYNPRRPEEKLTEIVSLTVIGPDVCEADRFATAAFAMQREGINFIGGRPGFEGYMIDRNGVATYTAGFRNFLVAA